MQSPAQTLHQRPINQGSGHSYRQYCSVARALAYMGERWTLLLVRPLSLSPKCFNHLLDGLPGIGTNLLTNRLKDLQAEGVVRRRLLPPPAGSTVHELTELGQGLEPAIFALRMWGRQFLNPKREDDAVNPAWFMVSLRATFRADAATDVRESYHLSVDGKLFMIRVNRGSVTVRQEPASDAVVSITTDLQTLFALLRYGISPDAALAEQRVTIQGDEAGFKHFVELFEWQPEQGARSDGSPSRMATP